MAKSNLKIIILIILSLCFFTGLIFAIHYFSRQTPKTEGLNVHSANPAGWEFYETAFKFKKIEFDLSGKEVVAGIIPHHLLAADLIAEFFYNLRGKNYDTVILLGPNHFDSGNYSMITSGYDWQTPYGHLE
ncbi:MAG: AmmeMemoRadiSam system protein B, partial [Patescibacteria group bacterium]|nr:AmmeMemoRadiSam system protein B [Patescibacteria group bacterium]